MVVIPSPANALGAKGAVPALAHAVLNALKPAGVRKLDMPNTPGRIWQALTEARVK